MKAYCTLWFGAGLLLILFNSCLLFLNNDLTSDGYRLAYTIRYYSGYFGMFFIGSVMILAATMAYYHELELERKKLIDSLLESE